MEHDKHGDTILLKADIYNCARCTHNHKQIDFFMFKLPVVENDGTTWTRWGKCPITGDPILMRVIEETLR